MYRPGRIRSDRWREIALLCAIEARTVPAIAHAMQVKPGSIQSLVRSMKVEGLLEEAESDARGNALKLTHRGRAELKKYEASGGVEGLLAPGERLVFVIDEGRGISADAIARLAADPSFRWAARVDGTVKWIASFGSADPVAADRGANVLVEDGARAIVGRSDGFFDAAGLADFARQLDRQPQRALGRAAP